METVLSKASIGSFALQESNAMSVSVGHQSRLSSHLGAVHPPAPALPPHCTTGHLASILLCRRPRLPNTGDRVAVEDFSTPLVV
ncbi:unnamed protein product [Lota lota]